jgi:short-subunit dehydrogenase
MPTALITGATAGIGAAFTRKLAADGFDLVLVARDEKRLAAAAAPLGAEVLAADLATKKGITAVAERTADVDLVVNNAGFGHRGTFLKVPLEDELRMLRVHCEAVLRITHAALPGQLERAPGVAGRGHGGGVRGGVINVASVAAFFSRGTYGASKAWVVSFSEGVNRDIAGTGVHVMALAPGFVHTEFHERAGMDTSGIPGPLWLDADKVADRAVRDFRRRVPVSVPGAQYKTMVGLGKLIPRNLAGRLSSRTGRKYD